MNLLRAEILRMLSRRLFKILALIILGGVLLVTGIVFIIANGVHFPSAVRIGLRITADVVFTFSVVVGASAVGAEWGSGSMATLLTWEPRRERVFAAKVGAVMIVASVFAFVALLFVVLLLVPSGVKHDTLELVSASWLRTVLWLFVRCVVITALGGALGVGLAGLMRSSAGPITLWLVFRFIAGPLLVAWRPGLFRWLPEANVIQFLNAGEFALGGGGEFLPSPSVWRGGLMLVLYALVPLVLSFADFRTRDVT